MPYEWNSDKTVENRVRTEGNPIFDVENLVESVEKFEEYIFPFKIL